MIDHEEWRAVDGAPYDVSNLGRVRRSLPGRGAVVGKILCIKKRRNGYGYVSLGRSRCTNVHNLVALAFLGPRPVGFEINHRNGNKLDNRVANLEYMTSQENKRHAIQMGLGCVGEKNPMAKLTRGRVVEIRKLKREGGTVRGIARSFGVSPQTIRRVLSGGGWTHVPD